MLEPEFEVIDVAVDGRALLKLALQLKPDGVVLEVALPQLNGIEAAWQLKKKLPAIKLIFLTANGDVHAAVDAFRSGASGFVLKRSGADEFMTAVRRVMRGESHLSPLIARETLDYLLYSSTPERSDREISAREAEVLQLLTEGHSMKQVAAILAISVSTFAFHKYKMMERLGIESSAELVQYAMKTYMGPPLGSWTVTNSAGTRLMDVPEDTRHLLPQRPSQVKSAARLRQRMENRYATDIQ